MRYGHHDFRVVGMSEATWPQTHVLAPEIILLTLVPSPMVLPRSLSACAWWPRHSRSWPPEPRKAYL